MSCVDSVVKSSHDYISLSSKCHFYLRPTVHNPYSLLQSVRMRLPAVCLLAHISSLSGLSVYGPVPGLAPSPHYSVQVREEGRQPWLSPFTLLTECTGETFCNTTGIFNHLANWSNSYVNFEMEEGVNVEVKITKLLGDPVIKAVVRPQAAAASCQIKDGEVHVVIDRPGLFTVDINGQMDDQDTGKLPNNRGYYDGPPIHTITIFANPFIDKPSLEDSGVYQVSPGEEAPSEGPWHTLYFLPGLHHIGMEFRTQANKSYYIPGDAVVYGTLTNDDNDAGEGVHIFGHGTLSGDRLPHPNYSPSPQSEHWKYRPVSIKSIVTSHFIVLTIYPQTPATLH